MERFEVDTVVVGAGVVGIAVARALALAGREVLILEKNAHFGEETSARNSEVIHAGIYYAQGSLKARHCLRGLKMLYSYCAAHGVPHRKCGKLIVATTDAECAALPAIICKAEANGVTDLQMLDAEEVRQLEPDLAVKSALLSPSTGIIDIHSYMLTLLGEAEAHGAQLVTRAPVLGGRVTDLGAVDLDIGGDEPMQLTARSLVNCAGLWAADLAGRIEGMPKPPEMRFVKGNYFSYSRKVPFKRLIYPAPRDGGLGVHLTLDMNGRAKFGPDTEWLSNRQPDGICYTVDAQLRDSFSAAVQTYWPTLDVGSLQPDYSGVRPKIAGADYPDFCIEGPASISGPHAMLYGIESPGLTASLSIAADLSELLQ
ncbi:NAD(P)/FAD-dependent oxidoreductase [Pseudorhodobacter turbinis]|uniref:NAD(P)/FAD-dependent oxidoreductase n=1 Tax=Pseudorhodobacter turbinis TaxID=2500533 RepID=A0A4P8EDU0_9RHOB|nr:NAD(P)/FAD-dependent oxidoreductase [Pseudorhodobacter turbinis]QCO54545.1 NAD(P)/FAD-dependent oxidoreductase [Pseudorhodobacter turbinis]